MSPETPPLRTIRSKRTLEVYYGFGDASGSAYAITFSGTPSLESVYFEYGQWTDEKSENSSNWRELNNLIESLEGYATTENIAGSEIFLFTDNTTAEATYWKGTSRSEMLFDLILRLKMLSLRHDLDLHVVHVSGRKMIAQWTDGLSRV